MFVWICVAFTQRRMRALVVVVVSLLATSHASWEALGRRLAPGHAAAFGPDSTWKPVRRLDDAECDLPSLLAAAGYAGANCSTDTVSLSSEVSKTLTLNGTTTAFKSLGIEVRVSPGTPGTLLCGCAGITQVVGAVERPLLFLVQRPIKISKLQTAAFVPAYHRMVRVSVISKSETLPPVVAGALGDYYAAMERLAAELLAGPPVPARRRLAAHVGADGVLATSAPLHEAVAARLLLMVAPTVIAGRVATFVAQDDSPRAAAHRAASVADLWNPDSGLWPAHVHPAVLLKGRGAKRGLAVDPVALPYVDPDTYAAAVDTVGPHPGVAMLLALARVISVQLHVRRSGRGLMAAPVPMCGTVPCTFADTMGGRGAWAGSRHLAEEVTAELTEHLGPCRGAACATRQVGSTRRPAARKLLLGVAALVLALELQDQVMDLEEDADLIRTDLDAALNVSIAQGQWLQDLSNTSTATIATLAAQDDELGLLTEDALDLNSDLISTNRNVSAAMDRNAALAEAMAASEAAVQARFLELQGTIADEAATVTAMLQLSSETGEASLRALADVVIVANNAVLDAFGNRTGDVAVAVTAVANQVRIMNRLHRNLLNTIEVLRSRPGLHAALFRVVYNAQEALEVAGWRPFWTAAAAASSNRPDDPLMWAMGAPRRAMWLDTIRVVTTVRASGLNDSYAGVPPGSRDVAHARFVTVEDTLSLWCDAVQLVTVFAASGPATSPDALFDLLGSVPDCVTPFSGTQAEFEEQYQGVGGQRFNPEGRPLCTCWAVVSQARCPRVLLQPASVSVNLTGAGSVRVPRLTVSGIAGLEQANGARIASPCAIDTRPDGSFANTLTTTGPVILKTRAAVTVWLENATCAAVTLPSPQVVRRMQQVDSLSSSSSSSEAVPSADPAPLASGSSSSSSSSSSSGSGSGSSSSDASASGANTGSSSSSDTGLPSEPPEEMVDVEVIPSFGARRGVPPGGADAYVYSVRYSVPLIENGSLVGDAVAVPANGVGLGVNPRRGWGVAGTVGGVSVGGTCSGDPGDVTYLTQSTVASTVVNLLWRGWEAARSRLGPVRKGLFGTMTSNAGLSKFGDTLFNADSVSESVVLNAAWVAIQDGRPADGSGSPTIPWVPLQVVEAEAVHTRVTVYMPPVPASAPGATDGLPAYTFTTDAVDSTEPMATALPPRWVLAGDVVNCMRQACEVPAVGTAYGTGPGPRVPHLYNLRQEDVSLAPDPALRANRVGYLANFNVTKVNGQYLAQASGMTLDEWLAQAPAGSVWDSALDGGSIAFARRELVFLNGTGVTASDAACVGSTAVSEGGVCLTLRHFGTVVPSLAGADSHLQGTPAAVCGNTDQYCWTARAATLRAVVDVPAGVYTTRLSVACPVVDGGLTGLGLGGVTVRAPVGGAGVWQYRFLCGGASEDELATGGQELEDSLGACAAATRVSDDVPFWVNGPPLDPGAFTVRELNSAVSNWTMEVRIPSPANGLWALCRTVGLNVITPTRVATFGATSVVFSPEIVDDGTTQALNATQDALRQSMEALGASMLELRLRQDALAAASGTGQLFNGVLANMTQATLTQLGNDNATLAAFFNRSATADNAAAARANVSIDVFNTIAQQAAANASAFQAAAVASTAELQRVSAAVTAAEDRTDAAWAAANATLDVLAADANASAMAVAALTVDTERLNNFTFSSYNFFGDALHEVGKIAEEALSEGRKLFGSLLDGLGLGWVWYMLKMGLMVVIAYAIIMAMQRIALFFGLSAIETAIRDRVAAAQSVPGLQAV